MQAKTSAKVDDVYRVLEARIGDQTWGLGCQIPTEVELASEFGCSRATVGKALARLVHEGLVERKTRSGTRVIRSTAASTGVQGVQLDAFAFVYPSDQHDGIRRIAQGFQEAAHAVQRRVIMLSTGTDFRKEGEIVGRLDEFDVQGVVVYPVLPKPEDRLYFAQMLHACNFPVVLADTSLPGFSGHSVIADGFHAGWTTTQHLLKRGLKKIGFLSNYAWKASVRETYLGYRQALEVADISLDANWVQLDDGIQPAFEHPLSVGSLFVKKFLQNAIDQGLEGVLCADDFLALVCLDAARELGISVPDQFKVVGVSDYAISAQSSPALTTYHVPFEEIGRQSFHVLNSLISGGKLPTSEVPVRGHLVVRKSG